VANGLGKSSTAFQAVGKLERTMDIRLSQRPTFFFVFVLWRVLTRFAATKKERNDAYSKPVRHSG
jgi:hypothetical protein